ncbi:MAG TPA: MASE1 domain-containing protein, partial [Isosphaeraceae bacterium]|nr:MASE1 domain-containing protein [Isosphaeraceae bacterium]
MAPTPSDSTPQPKGPALLEGPGLVLTELGIALVYFVAAKLGLTMASVAEPVTAVWPPTGIALAAVILCGNRVWPGIALGALVANLTAHAPLPVASGIATGNTLEALIGAWLLRRIVQFDPALERLRDALGLIFLAAVVSTTVSATIGVCSLCLGGLQPWSAFRSLWLVWWFGDAMGGLVMAPVLLTWAVARRAPWPPRRFVEGWILAATLIIAALAVFGGLFGRGSTVHPLVYIIFPFVIWAALRFGPAGATFVTCLASAIAIVGTVSGLGPFAKESISESLILLQIFMAVVAVTSLLLSAAITERWRAEESLRAADRRKNEFLAMLAHELRNPLGPIKNAVHLLSLKGPPEPELDEARAMIERQVGHMVRLIDDLLDVSRITRGRILLHRERIDLSGLVRATVQDYRRGLEAAGLSVQLELPAEPLWVQGDATRLAQVVGNLLQNAAKFSDAGACVTIRLSVGADDKATLSISDTGIGMAPDLLTRLFEPFTQADQSLARSRGGLGLGLALAKGLIDLHGGEIAARSEGPGRGSQLEIRLPLERGLVATPASAPGPAPAGKGCRVLVIEDNRDGAESMRRLLKLAGHQVEVADAGGTGLVAARQFRPDAVVCDLGLPGGMSGYDVARGLRGDAELAGAYLIALTGYSQNEHRELASEAGFDVLLTKPVNFDDLQRLL